MTPRLPPNDDYYAKTAQHDIRVDNAKKNIAELFNRIATIENNSRGASSQIDTLETNSSALASRANDIDVSIDALDSRVTTDESAVPSHFHSYTTLSDIPAAFNPVQHGNSKHTTQFLSGVTWNQIANKPTAFGPEQHGSSNHQESYASSTHTHSYVDVDARPEPVSVDPSNPHQYDHFHQWSIGQGGFLTSGPIG